VEAASASDKTPAPTRAYPIGWFRGGCGDDHRPPEAVAKSAAAALDIHEERMTLTRLDVPRTNITDDVSTINCWQNMFSPCWIMPNQIQQIIQNPKVKKGTKLSNPTREKSLLELYFLTKNIPYLFAVVNFFNKQSF
jgi:hypothetical protein